MGRSDPDQITHRFFSISALHRLTWGSAVITVSITPRTIRFYWMDQFGDPGFHYHVAAAQLWGTLAMRLADADGLPFDYTDYATQLREFFSEAMKLAESSQSRRCVGREGDDVCD